VHRVYEHATPEVVVLEGLVYRANLTPGGFPEIFTTSPNLVEAGFDQV